VPVAATAEILVPARDRNAVKAAPGATFDGMHSGYAAFQVGSGTYAWSSVA
jgi:alpha-L-rhamnosidase